jgi:hypothetical protein
MAKKKKIKFKLELSDKTTLIKQLLAVFVLNFSLQYIFYQQILGDLIVKYAVNFKTPAFLGVSVFLLLSTYAMVWLYNLLRKLGKPGASGAIRLALSVVGATYFPLYLGRFIFEAGTPDFLKWSFFLADTVQLVAVYLFLDLIKKR